jgi:hypothetical protein
MLPHAAPENQATQKEARCEASSQKSSAREGSKTLSQGKTGGEVENNGGKKIGKKSTGSQVRSSCEESTSSRPRCGEGGSHIVLPCEGREAGRARAPGSSASATDAART